MWECKYHIVWILKYRKKTIFGDLRKHLGGIDHEAQMVVVADGHGEIKEGEEEIHREEEQFDLVQALDSVAHETE
ncbi:MAG: transposase [Desulfurivibrionaceae bacterium]